jgi:hypothetical protein
MVVAIEEYERLKAIEAKAMGGQVHKDDTDGDSPR